MALECLIVTDRLPRGIIVLAGGDPTIQGHDDSVEARSEMKSSRLTPYLLTAYSTRPLRDQLCVSIACSAMGLIAWLAVRRYFHGPTHTPAPLTLGVVGLALAGICYLVRSASSAIRNQHYRTVSWVTLLLTIGLAMTLSGPTADGTALASLWIPVLLGITCLTQPTLSASRSLGATDDASCPAIDKSVKVSGESSQAPSSTRTTSLVEEFNETDAPDDETCSDDQSWRRWTGADGTSTCVGRARIRFLPQQRHAIHHVVVHPPFASVPQVEVEQADGPEAQIEITDAEPQGWRIEVRLAATSDDMECVTIEFHATCEGG